MGIRAPQQTAMNEDNLTDFQAMDDAARRDADIIAQLDAQQAMRNSASGGSWAPIIGLSIFIALTLPILIVLTVRSRSLVAAPATSAAPALVAGAAPAPAPANINWNYSFEGAQQQSRDTNKPMMVEFYTDWCGVCKRMDSDVYPDPAVIAETQNVVPVKINAEVRTDLAQRYSVNSYPTFIWMDGACAERYRISSGFSPASFLSVMQQNR
jgi:thiol:disulfide interchange protein